jgi:hypothetical protein
MPRDRWELCRETRHPWVHFQPLIRTHVFQPGVPSTPGPRDTCIDRPKESGSGVRTPCYVDEAGSTGKNLEDRQQPVFVMARLLVKAGVLLPPQQTTPPRAPAPPAS